MRPGVAVQAGELTGPVKQGGRELQVAVTGKLALISGIKVKGKSYPESRDWPGP